MSRNSRVRRHLPVTIWSLLTAALLLTPGDELPDPGLWDWLDKPLHTLLFAIHCGLLMRALGESGERGRGLAAAVLVSALYALLLETMQMWIPERSWEWWDLAADFAGIAVVALLGGRPRARLRASSRG
ncbi:MAG: VanZ family protein [Thermoanaerobaculia bacterium]